MKQRYTVGLFFVLLFLLIVLCISSFWMRHRKPAKMVDPYFYQSEQEAEDIENTSKTVLSSILMQESKRFPKIWKDIPTLKWHTLST